MKHHSEPPTTCNHTVFPRQSTGFTLVEMMFALTGISVLTAIFLSFYTDASQVAFVSDERNQINKDVRILTGEMSNVARQSNYFLLYKSFYSADPDKSGDQLQEGKSGDLLVFVFQGDPDNLQILEMRPTTRIVGYYRAISDPTDPGAIGPVKKFDLAIPDDDQDKPIEVLLPDSSKVNDFPNVVELSEGLADGKLFYNLWGKSVMVNGKLIHGNIAKRVTDTYNFTISPRGQQG